MKTARPNLRLIAIASLALVLALGSGSAFAALDLETVLPSLEVDKANASVFSTPLAYRDGVVYAATVEPGINKVPLHGLGLHTVIRRGSRDSDGHWHWRSHLLDANTANDPYHSQASIALDKYGYVHVVYNMHNLPWQYAVSKQPYSIEGFVFRGQSTSLTAQRAAQHGNANFPGLGSAAIPGNQITYPAFFTDRKGVLYVTYRYAVRPKRTWLERVLAGAIARYDVDSQSWRQVGGEVLLGPNDVALPPGIGTATTRPFAMQRGWWVSSIRLAFDRNNGMHASWLWRKGNAGPDSTHPSYAYSPAGSDRFFRTDGSAYAMPITVDTAELIAPGAVQMLAPRGISSPARISLTANGNPLVSIQVIGGRRYGILRDNNGNWQQPQKLPYDAWQIRFDDQGNEWAFASGLTVLRRNVDAAGQPLSEWRIVFQGNNNNGGNLCYPRAVQSTGQSIFYIYANVLQGGTCREDRIAIVRLADRG